MRQLFPSVVNIDKNGVCTYVNVRMKISNEPEEIQLPEYCYLQQFQGAAHIIVPTQHVLNGKILHWTLIVMDGLIKFKLGDRDISLSPFGISDYAKATEQYISAAIKAVQSLRICKGTTWCDDLSLGQPDLWSEVQDENSTERRARSPSCKLCLLLTARTDICENCKKFKHTKLTRKRKFDCTTENTQATPTEPLKKRDELDGNFEKLMMNLPGISKEFQTLLKSQVRNRNENKDPRHRRWDTEIISMCLSLWTRSPRAYDMLKQSNMLILPSERLLR